MSTQVLCIFGIRILGLRASNHQYELVQYKMDLKQHSFTIRHILSQGGTTLKNRTFIVQTLALHQLFGAQKDQ